MDEARVDAIAKLIAARGSRRCALALLAGSALLHLDPAESLAKNDRTRKRRRRKRRRQGNAGTIPASCYPGPSCLIGPGSDLEGCDFTGSTAFQQRDLRGAKLTNVNLTRVDARLADFQGADLGGACIVEANLLGAALDGSDLRNAIFCNTIMPDGTINMSGCEAATACCPTCSGDDCVLPGARGATCAPVGNICSVPFGDPCCPNSECTRPVPSKYFFLTMCMSNICSTTAQCAAWFPNQDVTCEKRGLIDCPQLADKCCKKKVCDADSDCPIGHNCCKLGFFEGSGECCAPGQVCRVTGCT